MAKAPRSRSDAHSAAISRAGILRNAILVAERNGDIDNALQHYQDLKLSGQMAAQDWLLLGDMLDMRGQYVEAFAAYTNAASMDRASARARLGLANSLASLQRPLEALIEYERGLSFDPDNSALWTNYGVTLASVGKIEKALASYDRALVIDPMLVPALISRGNAKAMLNCHDDAYLDYEKALSLSPNSSLARFNFALACLRRGDWARGFEYYESRSSIISGSMVKESIPGLWLGEEDIQGNKVLIDAEQGFGDTLMFCRFIPNIIDRGGIITVRVPRSLQAVVQTVDSRANVIAAEDHKSWKADRYIRMASLPLACKATPERLPAPPYLKTGREAPGRLPERAAVNGRRIGIVWSGGSALGNVRGRAIPLRDFLDAIAGSGEIVALQKEATRAERVLLKKYNVPFFGDELSDFSETASLAETCDLIITIDTSVAHLVGGMNLETWVLLPYFSDWRWSNDGDRCSWYPNTKLWRQIARNDWSFVLSRIKQALSS